MGAFAGAGGVKRPRLYDDFHRADRHSKWNLRENAEMANTYHQLQVHIVFVVRFRKAQLHQKIRERFHEYITGLVHRFGARMIQINSMPDHVHMLVGMKPTQNLADMMRIVKSESSAWVNELAVYPIRFAWQDGYGAFSVSRELTNKIIRYIQQQQEHHRVKGFREEYEALLRDAGIAYDIKYLFGDPV